MINFPDAPTIGQTFSAAGATWVWDGVKWVATTSTSVLGDPVTILHGGTQATTAAAARTNLGAAPLASPVFTGDPQAPTPATADNDSSLATTAFVKAQGYATPGQLNSYVAKAGDTMSGALNINAGGNALSIPSGGISVAGNGAFSTTLGVNGALTAAGTGTALNVPNGNISGGGNVTAAGYLIGAAGQISGALTVGTTLNVTGAITGGPGANFYNLQVGNVTSNGSWTTSAGGFAITVPSGGIRTGGNITIDSGGIAAAGNSSFGNATIGGTLSVGGVSTLSTINSSGHITTSGYYMGSGGHPILYESATGNYIQFDLTYGTWTRPIYNGTLETFPFATGWVKWMQYVSSGGPSGWQLNGYDQNNQLYGILVDGLSDERLKQNIQDTQVDALAALLEIPIRSFEWTQEYMAHWASTGAFLTDEEKAANRAAAVPLPVAIGLVAQEVQAVIPDGVIVGGEQPEDIPIPDGALTINNPMLMPYVIRAIQQLAGRMDAAGV